MNDFPEDEDDSPKYSKILTEEYSNIETEMRKRRLKFYGHIMRLPETFQEWIQNVKKDLEVSKITKEEIDARNKFRIKVEKWEVKPETKAPRIGKKWSEERKIKVSQKMKTWWANKNQKNGKLTIFT